jgi:predicted nucleic acid-binding Zn ribbon protein
VAESLDRVTRAMGAPRAQLLAAVFAHWEQLVGPDIAAHAQPRSLRRGVLLVAADQPAWATQLRFMSGDLLHRIASATDAEEITEIQVTVSAAPPGGGGRRGRR